MNVKEETERIVDHRAEEDPFEEDEVGNLH
jgi:hypothetical protein